MLLLGPACSSQSIILTETQSKYSHCEHELSTPQGSQHSGETSATTKYPEMGH